MNCSASPCISIITATLNVVRQLPFTIQSLREQKCKDFEWILIDGKSCDGTLDILTEASGLVIKCVSEPDRGIYDAWNKGCKIAKGDWLLFLGAGDELAGPETIGEAVNLLKTFDQDTPLVYGWQTLIGPLKRMPIERIGGPWCNLSEKWEMGRPALPPHGATFHHQSLFGCPEPFDIRYHIASDSHFLLRTIKKHTPMFIPIKITKSTIGGVSFRLETALQVRREVIDINRDLGINPALSVKIKESIISSLIKLLLLLPHDISPRFADLILRLQGKKPRWNVE